MAVTGSWAALAEYAPTWADWAALGSWAAIEALPGTSSEAETVGIAEVSAARVTLARAVGEAPRVGDVDAERITRGRGVGEAPKVADATVRAAQGFARGVGEAPRVAETAAVLLLLRVGRPASDVSTGGWTPVPLYAQVDEVSASDADFVSSPAGPAGQVAEMALSPMPTPAPGATSVITYRARGRGQAGSTTLTVRLMQGATVIASWQHMGLPGVFSTFTEQLTPAQQAAVSDWTALSVRLEAA